MTKIDDEQTPLDRASDRVTPQLTLKRQQIFAMKIDMKREMRLSYSAGFALAFFGQLCYY
jgi:hypothetical protein